MNLPDTQNERESRGIRIDRVGIRNLRYPMSYLDSHGKEHPSVGIWELTAELSGGVRGTHMSRFVEALHDAREEPISWDRLIAMSASLAARLDSARTDVLVKFPVFIEKFAPASGSPGLVDYEVQMSCRHELGRASALELEVKVAVATLCPCSKAISQRGAHNQRGYVWITAGLREALCYSWLIAVAEDSASAGLYSALKRSDEKVITELAYDQPVFVEDLARNVAEKLAACASIERYRVEVENCESIHHHDACAVIERWS